LRNGGIMPGITRQGEIHRGRPAGGEPAGGSFFAPVEELNAVIGVRR
jgi:hypothetical protein